MRNEGDLLRTNYWLLTAGNWLLATGDWLLATAKWLGLYLSYRHLSDQQEFASRKMPAASSSHNNTVCIKCLSSDEL